MANTEQEDEDPTRPPLADDSYEPERPRRNRRAKPTEDTSDQGQDDSGLDELAAINPKLAERRIKIEELRARIEERRADHEMMMALRKEDFRQQEFIRDRELLLGNNETWMRTYWRPAAGWIYLTICFMDFVGFPLISMLIPAIGHGFGMKLEYDPWESITLTQGGLIHLSFGAILGVSAWTRGQEKLAVMNKVGSN
jgi:hypothetical protein